MYVYIHMYMASLIGIASMVPEYGVHVSLCMYIYIYMLSLLGIVNMVWGMCFIFGYLDPWVFVAWPNNQEIRLILSRF